MRCFCANFNALKKSTFVFFAFFFLFFFFSQNKIFAFANILEVPDSSDVRKELKKDFLQGHLQDLRRGERAFYKNNKAGNRFLVRYIDSISKADYEKLYQEENKESEDEKIILKKISIKEDGSITEKQEEIFDDKKTAKAIEMLSSEVAIVIKPCPANQIITSECPQGTWILYRNSSDGKVTRIRWFFQHDEDVYVELRPDNKIRKNNCTLGNFVVCGALTSIDAILGLSIDKFYTMSFQEFVKLTDRIFQWHYVVIDNRLYDANASMAHKLRDIYQEKLEFEPDITMRAINEFESNFSQDEETDKLKVDDLSFSKWLIDGMIYPINHSASTLEMLTTSTVYDKETEYIDNRDIHLSLNWIRNLALALTSARTDQNVQYINSGVDVQIQPFTAILEKNELTNISKVVPVSGYVKDNGFKINILKPLLYILASTEPNYMYLAVIRETKTFSHSVGKTLNTSSTLQKAYYSNVLVFFPYFEMDKFNLVIFDSGKQISFEELKEKYTKNKEGWDNFVHFVRIRTSNNFIPNFDQAELN